MKTIVTGGAGFVGVNVVRELHRRGLGEIVVLDSCRNASAAHLAELTDRARLLEVDLVTGDIDQTFRSLHADTLIHLAGVHQASWCESHRAETLRINVEALERLLETALNSGVTRVFAASSSAVYAPLDRPYREEDRVEPPDFYGLTKAINEQQVRLWSAKSPRTHFALGRLFNVVGGFETSPRLAPEIVRRALLGDTIEIGNLKPRRDYVHVKDVARAIVTMVLDNRDPLDICNIGTGVHWSVEEMIKMVGQILGRAISFKSSPELVRSNERMLIAAEIGRITRRYDWRPRYSLEDALREAVAFAGIDEHQGSGNYLFDEAEFFEPDKSVVSRLRRDHQPRLDCDGAAEHPGSLAVEDESLDSSALQQVARDPHLRGIDALKDLNQR